jgi:hypothetical protein
MKIDITEIAEAVAEELKEYSAFVSYAPEFNLGALSDLQCVVVPVGYEDTIASRTLDSVVCHIEVGIMKRAQKLPIQDLVAISRGVAKMFLRKTLAGATCFKVEHKVLVDPDHLRERNQFTSVIAFYFKGVE